MIPLKPRRFTVKNQVWTSYSLGAINEEASLLPEATIRLKKLPFC